MKHQSRSTAPEAAFAPVPPNLQTKLGVLLGLLLVGLFVYPAAVNPLQSMALVGGLLVLGPAIAVLLTITDGPAARYWSKAASSPPVLAGWTLGIYALVRWTTMDLQYAGRESVYGWLAFGAAMTLGAAAGAVQRRAVLQQIPATDPPPETLFIVLRRFIAVAAIGFGLYACYQHFIRYPTLLAEMRLASLNGVRDLYTQSMLYLLEQGRPGGRLGPTNLYAAQLALVAVFCAACLRRAETQLGRIVGALGFCAAATGILLTRSRGGMLTLGLIMAAAGWMLLREWRMQGPQAGRRALGIALLWAAFAAQAQAQRVGWVQRLGNIATIRERLFYWEIAAKIWSSNWLIGAGPGAFEFLYLTYKPAAAREAQHAHSWIMELGCSLGAIGVALAGIIATGMAWRLLRGPRRGEAAWLGLAAVALAFNGLFEFTLEWPEFRIVMGFLIGAVCALTAADNPISDVGVAQNKITRWFSIAGGILISAGAAWMGLNGAMATLHDQRGDDARAVGDPYGALKAYQAAEKWAPGNPGWLLAQAEMLERAGRSTEAWPLLERAASLNPGSAAIPAQQAAWLIARNRLGEAKPFLDLAVERYGSNLAYHLNRAEVALLLNDRETAQRDADWIRAHPDLIEPYIEQRTEKLLDALK